MTGILMREAAISREEFVQHLTAATENRTRSMSGDVITIDQGRIVVRLTMKERPGEGPPLLLSEFAFENMSDEEVRLFMERFDRISQGVADI